MSQIEKVIYTAAETEIDLGPGEGGFFLAARLNVSLPGLKHETAQAAAAHQTCPYSKMSRGNIGVALNPI